MQKKIRFGRPVIYKGGGRPTEGVRLPRWLQVASRQASAWLGSAWGWVLWAAASGGPLNEHFVVILTHWVPGPLGLCMGWYSSCVSWWLLLGLLVVFKGASAASRRQVVSSSC